VIELGRLLNAFGITRAQLVDLAILVGTDFNRGVKGIGPKTALKLVQQHGAIEEMPEPVRRALGDQSAIDEVRQIFLHPEVTDDFRIDAAEPDFDGIVRFLCGEREFSRERVEAALRRAFGERPDPRFRF
jgi:flap endonuclease-1